MKLTCKQCGYNRNKLEQYEDYECPICFSKMNENKDTDIFDSFQYQKENIVNETVGMDEVLKIHIIESFKRDIKKKGENEIFRNIESINNAKTRASYRKLYFLALEEIKKEV